ncbi:MAG: pstP, partial [Marmoricola sp.]|nr:pstP [Marmoricola sp.]
DEGRITEDEARVHPHRNLILRAVDGVHEPEPDLFTVDLEPGDRVLVCSDGASGVLDNAAMARILRDGKIEAVAVQLVREALEAGSTDNVTVVLADVVDADAATPPNGPGISTGISSAISTAPMLVGAAAEGPRRSHGRGLLRHRPGDTGDLDPVPTGEDDVDIEALRYAPRAPRRLLWLRRLGVCVIVVAILGALGWAGYQWTQTQYYVADSAGQVAVFQGVQAELPGLTMHKVKQRTSIELTELPSYNARQVRDGIGANDLADAQAIIKRLQKLTPCPTPTPAATASRSATTTTTPHKPTTRKPTATATPRPTKTPTATATPKPPTDCDSTP